MNFQFEQFLCVFLIFVSKCCLAVIVFPTSPCPGLFEYEDVSTDGDRWYGVITKKIESAISGYTIHITLDHQSDLLASWEGNVISNNNQVYVIYDPIQMLQSGITVQFRIMVKYNPSHRVPFLQSIHMNGRRTCPDSPPPVIIRTTSAAPITDRPDIVLPDPGGDIWTDRTSRPPTTTKRYEVVTTATTKYRNESCGLVDMATPLITHGGATHRGQWPWHIALYKTEGVDLSYKCGGTLVSKNKVITAAHCVTNSHTRAISANQIIIYLGKYRLEQFADESGIQIKQVEQVHVHPEYNLQNFYGDIAVLTLSTDAEYTNFVRPICLWEATTRTSDIEGKLGSVVGWGFDESDQPTKDLRIAQMPVVSAETCLRSFPQFYSQFTSNATFCAGFRNGTSPCNGDSGGGLVFSRNSTWFLRGIVSLSVAKEGLNFCDPRYYVIFTDVAKHRDFIDRYIYL